MRLLLRDNPYSNRIWASGETPDQILSSCSRAFKRYKKRREREVLADYEARGIVAGFVVESAVFIATGRAGQGASKDIAPCVHVRAINGNTAHATFAHLNPFDSRTKHFIERAGLYWEARPGPFGPRPNESEKWGEVIYQAYGTSRVFSFELPYRVSGETLIKYLGADREYK